LRITTSLESFHPGDQPSRFHLNWRLSLSLLVIQWKWQTISPSLPQTTIVDIGDRIPAFFTNSGGFLQLAMQINHDGNVIKSSPKLEENVWYKLEVEQLIQNNQFFFVLRSSGREIFREVQRIPKHFKNVKVYASKYAPANAVIRNLVYWEAAGWKIGIQQIRFQKFEHIIWINLLISFKNLRIGKSLSRKVVTMLIYYEKFFFITIIQPPANSIDRHGTLSE